MLRTSGVLLVGILWALVALLAPASTVARRILHQEASTKGQLGSQRRDRSLLAAECKTVHSACTRCLLVKNEGDSTSVVCTQCDVAAGWRLRGGSSTCECAPGRYLDRAACSACPRGKYCTGRGTAPRDCPEGLATRLIGARTIEQCMTTPGWGRLTSKQSTGQLVVRSQLCPVGFFNTGGNTGPCKACPNGMTTLEAGSTAQSDCSAPAGSHINNGAVAKCPIGTFTDSFNAAPACTPCATGLTTAAEGSKSAADCELAKRGNYLKAVPIMAGDTGQQLDPGVGAQDSIGLENGGATNVTNSVMLIAVPCPVNTYQDADTAAESCTPCPNGLQTKEEGATGVANCLAPPGMELPPGALNIRDCLRGSYKEDWNLNPCIPCGVGLSTAEEGSVSVDACYVPAGYGIVINDENTGTIIAKMCVGSTYGLQSPSFDLKSTKCLPCPANTATEDVTTGTAALAGYTNILQCLPLPGMGLQADATFQPCPIGSWSAGLQQRACKACPSMYTTLTEGATSQSGCVVKPGWAIEASRKLPHPCNKGTYSLGGTLDTPGGVCTACPAGFTTQESASVSAADCEVCTAGRGGSECKQCPRGTYSYGGSTEDCRTCDVGYTSAHGAASPSECVPFWPLKSSYYVHIPLSDESFWLGRPAGESSEGACEAECASEPQCIMFRYKYSGIGLSSRMRRQVEELKTQQTSSAGEPNMKTFQLQSASVEAAATIEGTTSSSSTKCQVLVGLVPGTESFKSRAAVGFKAQAAGIVADYAFAYIPDSLFVGDLIRDAGKGLSLVDCMTACNTRDDCLLIRVTSSSSAGSSSSSSNVALDSCALYAGILNAEWMSSYRVSAERLLSDGFVVSTTGR